MRNKLINLSRMKGTNGFGFPDGKPPIIICVDTENFSSRLDRPTNFPMVKNQMSALKDFISALNPSTCDSFIIMDAFSELKF